MCNMLVPVRTVHLRNMQCPVCGRHGLAKNTKEISSNPTLSQRLEQTERGMQGANHCVPCVV